MDSMQQKWEKLTLADDFMFGKVMSDPKLCAEMLRRIFPDLDIGKIKIVETQKNVKTSSSHKRSTFRCFNEYSPKHF